MTSGKFRGKPSKNHIIWIRQTRDGADRKQIDQKRFRQWAGHYGFDFDTTSRVDHDRADEPRKQYRCTFKWTSTAGESIELDGQQWELGNQKTPRTFVEVDTKGWARVKGWDFESVYNVVQMKHDGPKLLIKSAEDETKRLDARNLVQPPESDN